MKRAEAKEVSQETGYSRESERGGGVLGVGHGDGHQSATTGRRWGGEREGDVRHKRISKTTENLASSGRELKGRCYA